MMKYLYQDMKVKQIVNNTAKRSFIHDCNVVSHYLV